MLGICARLRSCMKMLRNRLFVRNFRVVILGSEQSGKSTIVSRVFGEWPKRFRKQKDVDVYEFREGNINYMVYDVSGKRPLKARWDHLYRMSDVLLYCVDSSASANDLARSKQDLLSMLYRSIWTKRNMLVLGTKSEVDGAIGSKEMIFAMDLLSIADREISCFSVSASNGMNIGMVNMWLKEQCDAAMAD
ncbi:ADP-ribosylation factor family domain-containing protein [Ordospora pajunii]|uniref:ADP-ribosylation factor family domain-containing protein n=1 Tax=Ordospora pajunii TaxID=3039483 RepID=UPI0029526C62|nr:ADP-ribosylation factor family domain-containing protein [Ordospora pajunii]KAH9412255.1 ADP-ribosylation factor family domain-containing protein [Ordospora pajunii]